MKYWRRVKGFSRLGYIKNDGGKKLIKKDRWMQTKVDKPTRQNDWWKNTEMDSTNSNQNNAKTKEAPGNMKWIGEVGRGRTAYTMK
jgi:hypothetical protein